MAMEIVDFPMNMCNFHSYVSHYQRVQQKIIHSIALSSILSRGKFPLNMEVNNHKLVYKAQEYYTYLRAINPIVKLELCAPTTHEQL